MVGLKAAPLFFADKSKTVYVFCRDAVGSLAKKLAELAVGVVGIGCIIFAAAISDSYILRIVSICVVSRPDKSVGRIVGAGEGTVRQHIAVKVIAYRITVERDQTVVVVIREAASVRVREVARRVVSKAFGRDNNVTRVLNGLRGYSA